VAFFFTFYEDSPSLADLASFASEDFALRIWPPSCQVFLLLESLSSDLGSFATDLDSFPSSLPSFASDFDSFFPDIASF